MRRALIAALTTAMITSAASAADLPFSAPTPAPLMPAFTWTGIYAGAQIGYSWETDRTREFYTQGMAYTGVQFDYHPDTALAGGHIGANYQFGALVLGAEGDVEALRARGGFNDAGGRSPVDPGGVGRVSRDWQASVRGRIGYAMDRMMVYGTGGVAFTDFKYNFYNPTVRAGEGTSVSRTGWTAGVGISYAVTDKMIVGVEYRHTDFGKFNYVARSAFLGLTGVQTPTSDSVRASVSYKF